jgi:uncharacterized membrane protein
MGVTRHKEKEPQGMRVERSATIDQPVDRVFDYVSTPENDPTWVPTSLRHEMLSPAPMRLGSITEEDVRFLGRRMRYAWEITQYEPPSTFTPRSISGAIPATIRVLLESLDGARTRVILVGEVHLRGIYKPMELVMRWVAREQFGTQLRTLRNLLESEAYRANRVTTPGLTLPAAAGARRPHSRSPKVEVHHHRKRQLCYLRQLFMVQNTLL